MNSVKLKQFICLTINHLVFDMRTPEYIGKAFLGAVENNKENAKKFVDAMKVVKDELKKDLNFFLESDPAINSVDEVVLAYPGYKAICYYRVAHILFKLGYLLEARIITEEAHSKTGIDIHPAATISSPLFIDHGTGIVIGETSIIGKNVKLYQGVTLGALSLAKGSKMKGTKRHPTILDNVTIYANASVLGDVVIGNNVTIGGSVFLMEDIPDNSKVSIGKPKLYISSKEK